MQEERFNFDENDEMTDEQYFSEDDGRALTSDDMDLMNAGDDQPEVRDNFDEDITEDEYRVSSITDNFLRVECSIKLESSKTPVKFRYRGEELKGIVLQKINSDNYVFLVKPIGKKAPKNAEKKMRKIYIPDAELI